MLPEASPDLVLPVGVVYPTTPTTRLRVWPRGAEAMLYLLGLMRLSWLIRREELMLTETNSCRVEQMS